MNEIRLEFDVLEARILLHLLEINKNYLSEGIYKKIHKKLTQALDSVTIDTLGLSKESGVFLFSM